MVQAMQWWNIYIYIQSQLVEEFVHHFFLIRSNHQSREWHVEQERVLEKYHPLWTLHTFRSALQDFMSCLGLGQMGVEAGNAVKGSWKYTEDDVYAHIYIYNVHM